MSVELKCRKHPKYKAVRKPTADCEDCLKLWNLKQELEAPKQVDEEDDIPDICSYIDEDTLDRVMVDRGYDSDESGWHNGWQ